MHSIYIRLHKEKQAHQAEMQGLQVPHGSKSEVKPDCSCRRAYTAPRL